jgi:hypothetical protein
MSSPTDTGLGPLIDALAWYDEHSRVARAERIAWASSLYQTQGIVAGPIVPLHLMEEARISFVNGQFMAVVLSATSVVEHLLLENLEANSIPGNKNTLAAAIACARKAGLVDDNYLGRSTTTILAG